MSAGNSPVCGRKGARRGDENGDQMWILASPVPSIYQRKLKDDYFFIILLPAWPSSTEPVDNSVDERLQAALRRCSGCRATECLPDTQLSSLRHAGRPLFAFWVGAASPTFNLQRCLDYRVAVMVETALAAAWVPESLALPRFAVPLTAFEVVRVVVPAATALTVPDR